MKLLTNLFFFVLSLAINKNNNSMASVFDKITETLFKLDDKIVIVNFGIELKIVDSLILRFLKETLMPYVLKTSDHSFDDAADYALLDGSAILTFNSVASLKKIINKV